MSCVHTENKEALKKLHAAMTDFEEASVRSALRNLIAPDALIHMPHPLGDLTGPDELYDICYAPLFKSMPDLERRDWILMGGQTEHGGNWIGCGGHYMGTFVVPYLDIPPTGHLAHMRFHEFYKFEEGRVVEIQTLWDIPELMMQAGAWPMAPSLGLEFHIPGPATLDGFVPGPWDKERSEASCRHIVDMLDHLKLHPSTGGPEVMDMPRFWHPRMNWYGPAGIGTGRGISGFRNWHQIPFLNGMPDRGLYVDEITYHFFGDNDYVAVTGWPDMIQTVTHDGWMGIAPSGKKITMCSLDFWRIENGKIRENWVMVDILDAYRQLDVDVLARMREFNKARVSGSIPFPVGDV
ncbi:SnoaL-like polyketide cyclase [Cognatiyoonia sediminum]|uniref:SnoaL-like polyketide cyclase n=1 Tax=Cognatiyoonia sediminum TaxID=1508389 RepID=A0A1M5SRM3_9RHOB|nr:ester cyclase [Cognatiyoonia sediminum]SHH40978.1 SnoaL-like polyketide cyclase [Cognatiyoonia sediminum]